jgi:hypothetical protein
MEKVEKKEKERKKERKTREEEKRKGMKFGGQPRGKKPDGKKGPKKSATTARRQLFSNWTTKKRGSGNPFGAHFTIGIRTLKSHVADRPRN